MSIPTVVLLARLDHALATARIHADDPDRVRAELDSARSMVTEIAEAVR